MVSIIFVGFQPPKLYLNLNIISQLSQLFDSSIPSVLMVISHCCWGSSCASERNRWFWPAKKAEICSEFRQCQQWRRFKSSVPAKKKIQQETVNENRDFFPRHNGFSVFFSQNSIRMQCLEVCSRANFATWFNDLVASPWGFAGVIHSYPSSIGGLWIGFSENYRPMDNSSWQTIVR